MPSLREYQALWDSASDVYYCQTVQKEHPELHALLAKALDIMDSWGYQTLQAKETDDMSDIDSDSDVNYLCS